MKLWPTLCMWHSFYYRPECLRYLRITLWRNVSRFSCRPPFSVWGTRVFRSHPFWWFTVYFRRVGSHTDGTPEPDFQKQVRLAFENLKATLTAAGCTFDDIVDVTTFHTDPEQQLNDVMAVKQEIFAHPPYPNWTAVGVTWLAGFDFEIKVITRIPWCLFSVKPVALYRFYFIHPCPSSCMINMQSPNISNWHDWISSEA